MLFLDRIEILGFKSFCEKTVLKVPTGMTAIVGPNGCGKSNVVDALNWVLGEQSAKSLRSDKMEEVIFNGSKNRKPLNLAQVSLIWKAERENPAAPEISITRRLFRSGESQYEMNGEICRLKDIHAFFINEGFDPLAYSILEQGKIEYLFASKPSERRTLIEEVAGVAEFKHKKRSAQMKLADNQIQLERVQDILTEVEKQLGSLKRQAAKARRHQFLMEEKHTIQRISFHRRFHQIELDLAAIMEQLAVRVEAEQAAAQSLHQQELVSSEIKLRLTEVESRLYHDQSALHHQEMQIQENQNALASRRQRIEELKRMITDKQSELERLIAERQSLDETLQFRKSEEEQLRVKIEEVSARHSALFADFENSGNELSVLENKAQQLRKETHELLVSASHLKNEQIRLSTQHDHLSESIARKEQELDRTRETHTIAATTSGAKRTNLDQIHQEIGYLDLNKQEILQTCEQLKHTWDQLQQDVQICFKRQFELKHEIQKLDAQQHSSKFYNESAKNLLNSSSRKTLGMMMDFVETEPQFETALENFLADKLNYLIVNEENSALESIDYLKQEGLGYCSFVIKNGHDPRPPVLPEELRNEEGFIGGLREVVKIKEEALPAVAPFVHSAVIVNDLNSAQTLIKKYPDYQFVTVQGDVILSPHLYAGGAKTDDLPGLIAIHRQTKELTTELETVEQRLAHLENEVRTIQDRLDIANHELVRINEVRELRNKDGMMVQMEIDQTDKEVKREERVIEVLMQELAQLNSEREGVRTRSEEFTYRLEQETMRRMEAERGFAEIEQDLLLRKEVRAQLQSQVQESRIELAELKERFKSLTNDIERISRQIQFLDSSVEDNKRQTEMRQQEISDTEVTCSRLETEQIELLRTRDEQKAVIEESERKKEALSAELTGHEAKVAEARNELSILREQRSTSEIEKTRIETQKEDLLTRSREEMGIELAELTLPESELTQLDDENLRARLNETEEKIEKLGSINSLALEEYVQMEERHRFLNTQYNDLKVSIETLIETIQRIDQTSTERFNEALQGVQKLFQDLFQRLFNGGKAEIVLVDPENPQESGLDIHVQPPGKRLGNITLLSGGEKALSGVAFLMALFQYHASPFCVMDEVEAALDEANVSRFTSLISEMKKNIQFILVTHNKRTMEAADQLYGVTMAEPGVSSVLSAKFSEAEAFVQ